MRSCSYAGKKLPDLDSLEWFQGEEEAKEEVKEASEEADVYEVEAVLDEDANWGNYKAQDHDLFLAPGANGPNDSQRERAVSVGSE